MSRFRFATYNMHKGIGGLDRRYRLDRVIEALKRLELDILFLQEVDEGAPRSRHHRQVDLLAEALQLPHQAFQANVQLKVGSYGNAILSRYPLAGAHDLDLTIRFKKRRRALIAECLLPLEWASEPILLANMHLGLAGFERSIQLKRLIASDPLMKAHPAMPVIAAGDFNDVYGNLHRRHMQPAGFQMVDSCRTFPAYFPLRGLDRIFYRGLKVHHSFASRCDHSRRASDHLPLVADFGLDQRADG